MNIQKSNKCVADFRAYLMPYLIKTILASLFQNTYTTQGGKPFALYGIYSERCLCVRLNTNDH